jgi:hypothetical protein
MTPKPPVQLTVPGADKREVGARYQDNVPPTPMTPVSAESIVLLQNLIKQDAHTLNKASIQRLERHVQKLAYAAQVSLAERAFLSAKCAFLDNRNQMLTRMNNKAKVRRSTRSIVLGKAKVMSFEDIEVARAARAVKDAKGKGKRGRKRKSAALEPDEPDEPEADEPEPEPEPEMARAVEEVVQGRGKRGLKRKTAVQEAAEPEPEPEPEGARTIEAPVWRAPVARMI